MLMPDIIICEFMDEDAVNWLKARADVHYDPHLVDDKAALFAAIKDVPALIVRSSARIDQELLDAAPDLKVVGRLGVGLERFDLDACAARNVAVVKSTGANALSVAEYVMAMTLTLLRPGTYHSSDVVASGAWPRLQLVGRETAGKTLAIIGLGNIGRVVARHASLLGMNVIANDPYVPASDPAWSGVGYRESLAAVVSEADIVTLHTPLTEETRHLLDTKTIGQIKPGAVVINSARGPVIDNAALAEALRSSHLSGAAIDVYETEPLSCDDASVFDGLANVILTPHVAGVTEESNRRVSQMTAELTLAELQRAG